MGAFAGRAVLILGGSRGTDAATVCRFATDGTNVRFTYTGLKDAAERLARETGMTVVFTDSTDKGAAIDVVRKSDILDILVVNVSISVPDETLELDADNIDRLSEISTHAPYHAPIEAVRQVPEGGRILIVGSVNGDRMPIAGVVAYAASESTLQDVARELAHDFGPRGITINVVQSGLIDTDTSPANGPIRDMLHSLMTTKRHGQPGEVAGMVAWLAGPEAGSVTGVMHTIDGVFGAQPTILN